MKYLILLAAVALSGCADRQSTASDFFKADAGYTATLQAAAAYTSLPRCGEGAPTICSKQDVVVQIRKAANAADATVQAAEDTIRQHPDIDASFAIAAAQNAMQALTVILQQYSIGAK